MDAPLHTQQQYRRRTNGTIDFDHYRQEARMLRQATRTEFVRGVAKLIRPLVAFAIIGFAIATMPTSAPDPANVVAMSPAITHVK